MRYLLYIYVRISYPAPIPSHDSMWHVNVNVESKNKTRSMPSLLSIPARFHLWYNWTGFLLQLVFLRRSCYCAESRWVWWWHMAHDVVNMTVEQCWAKLLCEMVSHIDGCIHSSEQNEVSFSPFTEDIEFDVHVARPGCWFPGIGHCSACIIVFI